MFIKEDYLLGFLEGSLAENSLELFLSPVREVIVAHCESVGAVGIDGIVRFLIPAPLLEPLTALF